MNGIAQDLRFTFRQMRRSPGFFVLAVLTLGLGIGAATAVFSVLHATFLEPLPYVNQARAVSVEMKSHSGYQQPASFPSYVDVRKDLQAFSAVSAVDYVDANLQTQSGAAPAHLVQGSDDFFEVFGDKPLLGRGFLPGEEAPGRNHVAVLSWTVWQQQMGGRADVIGAPIRLNGEPYTVVGVMPRTFRFPIQLPAMVYVPLNPPARALNSRGFHEYSIIGALKPGVDLPRAQADVARVMAELGQAYPDTDAGRTATVVAMGKVVNGTVAQPLTLISGAVLALLLIACVNVTGLLLARGVRREHEMALRAAVGASRRRLTRQAITETLTIAVLGAAVGTLLAAVLLASVRAFMVQSLARGLDVRINGPVLAGALLLAALTTLLAGLLPALRLSRVSPNEALRSGSVAAGTGRKEQRLRSGLLVTQVALSLVLLCVSGLLVQELRSLASVDFGFPPDRILAVRVSLGAGDYAHRDPLNDFYQPLLERVQHLPGAAADGLVSMLPIEMSGSNMEVHVAGQPPLPPNEVHLAEFRLVSAGYFDAMDSHLMAGRALTPSLDRPEVNTFVVNQAFAKEFVPKAPTAVGAALDNQGPDRALAVGQYTDMRQTVGEPALAEMDYLMSSEPVADRRADQLHMFLVVRALDGVDPKSFIAPLRQIVRNLDAGAALDEPMTMREQVNEALVSERMEGSLFGAFAGCALLLTLVGIYGTLRHEAELRVRDIGVRMALGASRGAIVAGMLRRAGVVATVGLGCGLLLTLGAQRTLASLVELKPQHEPVLLLALAAGLFAVCLLSALGPAQRAAATDPMQALRTE